MTKTFNHIGLVGKQKNSRIIETLQTVIALLQAKKIEMTLEKETAHFLPDTKLPTCTIQQLGKHCDLGIVIGGDGSLLNVARHVITQNLPLVGINLGSLGFLTDIRVNEIKQKLTTILSGQYHEEQRFLLESYIEQRPKQRCLAVNEIVLTNKVKMIEFEIYVDNKFVCSQRSDGLIIATPTGSTAYSLSGGGPILHPELDVIVLMAMFPHTLGSRPIVINANHTIKIMMTKSKEMTACVSSDGNTWFELNPGETLCIQKTKQPLQLIHPADYDYFEALRSKLHWGRKLTEHHD